ncbi:MAG TPA: GNAT family N-acetyltransferase [Vicinamibacterales bacterium]|nr:GNAT family N-acetyltransferase [Vicinamibacterales bacterium]
MTIRTATAADAAVVADLARRTFYDTFASTNDAADMALYLEGAYGVDQQTRELMDRDITTLLVEEHGDAVAYAQIRIGHIPECVTGGAPIELWRFYVDRGFHGRGIAQELMHRVKQLAVERGAKTLWLGVWERNDRARAFYVKCGFADVGEHIFLFGTDPQTDRVMVTSL